MDGYDFDRVIDRRGSNAIKWDIFSEGILPLWVADMDFASPMEIISGIQARLDHPIFGYQSQDTELLDVIRKWIFIQHGWKIEPEDILLMPGVVAGFNWVVRSFTENNNSVIFQTPVYFPFFEVSKNNNVRQITVPLKNTINGYEIDFDDFEIKIRDDTRIFILCNPHNPVGRVFRKKELERLGEICLAHNIIICSDEIHCDLVFPGHRHLPIASLSEKFAMNTITLMAPSKTFNIPGLHFSFAIVQNEILRNKMTNTRNGMIGEPNILAQSAAKAAYEYGGEWLEALLKYLNHNRKLVVEFIRTDIPEIRVHSPEGTYLAWLDCSALNNKEGPFKFFLENAKVALNDGEMFGGKSREFVRLNFGCPKPVLMEALNKMAISIQQAEH
jgi:cystathionine beta-lyase